MIEPDPSSPVPLYLQISDQIRRLIVLGALLPGDRLPTVRDLAVQARVNRNTAARAIQRLESEGVVRTRVGQGTFVESKVARVDHEIRDARVDKLIDALVLEAHTLGLPIEELRVRLSRGIEHFNREREAVPRRSGSDDGDAT